MSEAERVEAPSVTCSKCGKRSFHPKDIEEKYCGFCHVWWEDMRCGHCGEVVTDPDTHACPFRAEIPELRGVPQEELRFWRLIDERTYNADGSEDIKLACGHEAVWATVPEEPREYALCLQCLEDWVEAEKKKQE